MKQNWMESWDFLFGGWVNLDVLFLIAPPTFNILILCQTDSQGLSSPFTPQRERPCEWVLSRLDYQNWEEVGEGGKDGFFVYNANYR